MAQDFCFGIQCADDLNTSTLLPNYITPAKGEKSLYDKIKIHLANTAEWIYTTFIDRSVANGENREEFVDVFQPLLIAESLRRALPSLDLVLTPNGFAVTSTSNLTPASAQRVAALRDELIDIRDLAIRRWLVDARMPEAANTAQSEFFSKSLFCDFNIIDLVGESLGESLPRSAWERFLALRQRALEVQTQIESLYIGPDLMRELCLKNYQIRYSDEDIESRTKFIISPLGQVASKLIQIISNAIVNKNMLFDQRWALVEIVDFIRKHPEDFEIWHNSPIAEIFNPPIFHNEKKSAGFFF